MTQEKLSRGSERLAQELGRPDVAGAIEQAVTQVVEEERRQDWETFGEPEEPERWDGMN